MNENDWVPFSCNVSTAALHRITEEAERYGIDVGEVLTRLVDTNLPDTTGPLWYRAPRRWWECWWEFLRGRSVTPGDILTDLVMKYLPVSEWEKSQEDDSAGEESR
jgi:hypothetical protein